MNTSRITSTPKSSGGYALLMVLAMGAVSAIIVGAAVTRTINTATLNERNNQTIVNLNAAEAAVEMVVAHMMADYQKEGESLVKSKVDSGSYRDLVPTAGEHPYWEQFEFSNGEGIAGKTHVTVVSNNAYVPLESQYGGLNGWVTTYRIISNVRQTTGRFHDYTNAVRQDIQIASIPLFQFAIFYNGLMEFTISRDLTVNGRTHANGDIFYSSSGPITFNAPVTSTGTIQKKTSWGTSSGGYSGPTTFSGLPDYRTNIAQLSLFIGTNNTSTNLHKIIEMPPYPSALDSMSPLGRERFYYKAGMVLLVSDPGTNTLVTAIIKRAAIDPDPAILDWSDAVPDFISTTNFFWDSRETNWMKTTEIDIGKLANWISTTNVAGKHPPFDPLNIIYVADIRSSNSTTNTAIRLVNGGMLPRGFNEVRNTGFTVATPNPLYIKGDYNTISKVPAALVSDALTILSANWNDTNSSKGLASRPAIDTTVDAAIVTGNVPSRGLTGNAPFSGGVMNLPRLLEDWQTDNKKLKLTNSLVNLFASSSATGRFTTDVYRAPRRFFFYDPSFAEPDKLPPGTPMLSVLIRARWSSPPPNFIAITPPED